MGCSRGDADCFDEESPGSRSHAANLSADRFSLSNTRTRHQFVSKTRPLSAHKIQRQVVYLVAKLWSCCLLL